MRFAYADPPYIGCAARHYKHDPSGIPAAEVDHKHLIENVLAGYDGWALSTHSPGLTKILPLCPAGVRIGAWVKPFVPFRGSRVAMAWEPVIYFGARTSNAGKPRTVRDWIMVSPPIFTRSNISSTRGEKPVEFCYWLFNLLGIEDGDTLDDLFPGSGAVTSYLSDWRRGSNPFVRGGAVSGFQNQLGLFKSGHD